MSDRVYYAIGDVHGEADRLRALHDKIRIDIAGHGRPSTIVHLGDLIDRGPDSRGAVEAAMRLHAQANEQLQVVTLRGNHEQLMVDALRTRDPRRLNLWLVNGGEAAVASYLSACQPRPADRFDAVDPAHLDWLAELPNMHRVRARGLVFVHAGIEPAIYPHCSEETRLWTRADRFFDERQWPNRAELADIFVVHGHTPTAHGRPDWWPRRLNIDTGAVFGGPLTCAVMEPNARSVRFLGA